MGRVVRINGKIIRSRREPRIVSIPAGASKAEIMGETLTSFASKLGITYQEMTDALEVLSTAGVVSEKDIQDMMKSGIEDE